MTTKREYLCKKCKKNNDYTIDDVSQRDGRGGGYDDSLSHNCNGCGHGNTVACSFPKNEIYSEWLAKYRRWHG